MNIGQRMKERRKELKMSADELGKKLNKDRSTIYRYEKGDIENLPLELLEPIAKALDTTPQYLMGWEQVQKNNDTLADIIVRARLDKDFFALLETINQYDADKIKMLSAFLKQF